MTAAPRVTGWLLVTIIAVVLLAVGSFGPWATLGIFHANGLDGSNDGWVTLVTAALSGAALWRLYSMPSSRGPLGVLLFLAVVAGGVGIHDARDVSSRKTQLFGQTIGPRVGWGLYVVIAASAVLVVATVAIFFEPGRGE